MLAVGMPLLMGVECSRKNYYLRVFGSLAVSILRMVNFVQLVSELSGAGMGRGVFHERRVTEVRGRLVTEGVVGADGKRGKERCCWGIWKISDPG